MTVNSTTTGYVGRVGIELGGHALRVAYAIAHLDGRSSTNTTEIRVAYQSISLTAFLHLVGRNPVSDSGLDEYANSKEFISASGINTIVHHKNATEMGMEFQIGGEKYFMASTYLLVIALRAVFHAVTDFSNDQGLSASSLAVAMTVPAWFDKTRQDAVLKAAILAGFETAGILSNAMASTLTLVSDFGTHESPSLLVDIGHGTAQVMLYQDGRIIGSEHDLTIGGRDLDTALASTFGNTIAISCLYKHYKHTNDLQVLNHAILYMGYILERLEDHDAGAPGFLANAAALLSERGEHLAHIPDLELGAKYAQKAIGLLTKTQSSATDLDRLDGALSNLGNILQSLYRWTGKPDDLYNMIRCYESALELTKEKGYYRAANLNRCGAAVMLHFEHFGDKDDVDKALLYFEEALECVSNEHPSRRIYLARFIGALQAAYRLSNDVGIIDRAINMTQELLSVIPDRDSDKPIYLNKLGNLLGNKADSSEDPTLLDHAITYHHRALEQLQDHQLLQRFTFLNNLGTSYHTRFQKQDTIPDINRSIEIFEEAIELIDEGSDRAKTTANLASAYYDRFVKLRNEEDRVLCMKCCQSVVNSFAPLAVRYTAATVWKNATAWSVNGQDALDAATTMVSLLSQLAWPGLSLSSQMTVLKHARQSACDAAATALHFKDVVRALEWLEQGRTIAWNQLLQLRSPLAGLHAVDHDLAENIERLSKMLERGSPDTNAEGLAQTDVPLIKVSKAPAFSRNAIALERDKLLQKARKLPGFENLMTSKEYMDFAVVSPHGPVIVLNASRYRCDAIILVPDRLPFHLPLPDFSLSDAEELKTMLHDVLKDSARLQRGIISEDEGDADDGDEETRYGKAKKKKRRADTSVMDAAFRHILKELFEKIVHPIMLCVGIVSPLSDEEKPHVWWCPTGPLTFLPLHAAGIYTTDDDLDTARISALDFMVSSYIPNLGALHNIMYNKSARPPFSMLSIVQPNTPGMPSLPGTRKELEALRKYTEVRVLEGRDATMASTMAAMREHSWVHLSCHGEQDVAEPTKSGLYLQDGLLRLQDIIDNPLPNADFAFLSACQTASGDVSQPDEAIHLAAGMLLAGFNSVIASMWSIGDNDAVSVADDVYGQLFQNGKDPDSRSAARALNKAVVHLRTLHTGRHGGSQFAAWVPFIHVGM